MTEDKFYSNPSCAKELYHHGVKGQKWGVRRYVNKDGSLTEEGKKKYLEDSKLGKYDKYQSMGLSKEDQVSAKYNSDKIKKIAAIAGGVALGATALYLGRQYVANNMDTFVKSGTKLQTIMDQKNIDTGKQFYTAIHGLDKFRYGAIGVQMGFGKGKNVYRHTMEVGKDFKIASNKSAAKVFNNLMKNDNDFANTVKNQINLANKFSYADPFHGKGIRKAAKEIGANKVGKNTYDIFNVQLAGSGFNDEIKNKFYNEMKKAGYAGIKDVNDIKFTNYRSITPAIMFDAADKIKNVSTSKLSKKHYRAGIATVLGQGYGKILKTPVAGIIGYKGYKAYSDPKKVAQYRKEHPNSKKTYSEILDIV